MKLTVKYTVSGDSNNTKELVIHNPAATLSNLRAAIAINFRLPVHSFRMLHSSVDITNEKILLRDSGIKDGDLITVATKRNREDQENDNEEHEEKEEERKRKEKELQQEKNSETIQSPKPSTELTTPEPISNTINITNVNSAENKNNINNGIGEVLGIQPINTVVAAPAPAPAPAPAGNNTLIEEGEEAEVDYDDDDNDDDDDDDLDGGPGELLSHLLATVPNLVEMRQQFLANPTEIMQQIRERDPRLLELITANQQEFLDLVNNEALVETLQQEQEEMQAALFDEEGEFDEETEETMQALMAHYLNNAEDAGEMFSQHIQHQQQQEELEEEEGGEGAAGGDESREEIGGGNRQTETQRYLERVPTEEEEAKIEQLMQLGFTRDQCKVAFFKAKRSLERAANLLFEDPPQL